MTASTYYSYGHNGAITLDQIGASWHTYVARISLILELVQDKVKMSPFTGLVFEAHDRVHAPEHA